MKPHIAQLIVYLKERGSAQPDDLAALFSTTRRTIRNYVRSANEELAGIAQVHTARDGGAYSLDIFNHTALNEAIDPNRLSVAHNVPQTTDERVIWLIGNLCAQDDWTRIDELAESLFVSGRTISKDLKGVEERLEPFGLRLEKKPHRGIRIAGPEIARRMCLSESGLIDDMLKRASLNADSLGCNTGRKVVQSEASDSEKQRPAISLTSISLCVDTALERGSYVIKPHAHRNLVVHIAIAIMRISSGCHIPLALDDVTNLKRAPEYSVAMEVAHALEHEFSITLPEEEIVYISMHLAGKQQLDYADAAEASASDATAEAWELAGAMIDIVWRDFQFDFRQDIELRVNLVQHIVPLLARLRYGMEMSNPLTSDIKRHYPLAWSMAFGASSVLSSMFGKDPSEDEIGYLALAFALAVEREKAAPVMWDVLVVCASGAGTARLLEWRIKREFSTRLNSVSVCDVSHARDVDYSAIDYVFTTVPLSWNPGVPVCQISCFFDDRDIDRVNTLLSCREQSFDVERFFDRDLFFTDLDLSGKEGLLNDMCERVKSLRTVPDDFTQLVFEREHLMSSAMGGLVAMPHPVRPVVDRTFAAVAILPESIDWDGHEVRIVVLACVSVQGIEEKGLKDFYETVSRMLIDTRAIQGLLDIPRFETLVESIRFFSSEC